MCPILLHDNKKLKKLISSSSDLQACALTDNGADSDCVLGLENFLFLSIFLFWWKFPLFVWFWFWRKFPFLSDSYFDENFFFYLFSFWWKFPLLRDSYFDENFLFCLIPILVKTSSFCLIFILIKISSLPNSYFHENFSFYLILIFIEYINQHSKL